MADSLTPLNQRTLLLCKGYFGICMKVGPESHDDGVPASRIHALGNPGFESRNLAVILHREDRIDVPPS